MTAKEMNRLDLIDMCKQLAADGYSAVEIASLLKLNESTVRSYINY